MWNATKKKREQERWDSMVTSVGMPPGWEPIGRDKKGWVYRWCKGDSYVEHYDKRWCWYTGIKTKHMKENGAFTCPVACAVACELTMSDSDKLTHRGATTGRSQSLGAAMQESWWRCHHPAFKTGDELMEFLDPVSCAVAQEVAG